LYKRKKRRKKKENGADISNNNDINGYEIRGEAYVCQLEVESVGAGGESAREIDTESRAR
jgi:hypothetical protein